MALQLGLMILPILLILKLQHYITTKIAIKYYE